ncbi:STAS domain-containing protein [Limnobacter sp.]|uniref:STAS domain-containing protein n=1 Tax=Limnobacter sp. TaxID=2003368 RepID=UPI0035147476
MSTPVSASIASLLVAQRDNILNEWVSSLLGLWSKNYPGSLNEAELRAQVDKLLGEVIEQFNAEHGTPEFDVIRARTIETIRQISISRAKQGFKPTDTAQLVFFLKNICTNALNSASGMDSSPRATMLIALQDVLDHLSLANFESYVETREKVIAQQSLSLQELSSPVVRMWDQILLLPLVGVVDTFRARQVTERLLEAISRYEAVVTIIDVTGVPVFDTGVARHIMKAVDAAQLLGSRIVITGISPEGAQTLTKLGISFEGVTSRATLRAGVAEAFAMINRRVLKIQPNTTNTQ